MARDAHASADHPRSQVGQASPDRTDLRSGSKEVLDRGIQRGGAANHPSWYLNPVKNPDVELQVGAEKFAARARTATRKEKTGLWPRMSKIFPHYDKYQARTGRDIPLVIVDRV